MNILDHDSEGKYYHEYISRGRRCNEIDAIIIPNKGTSCSSPPNGAQSSPPEHPSKSSKRLDGKEYTRNNNKGESEVKCKASASHKRMEISSSDILIGSIKEEVDSSNIFTCGNCSKSAYKDGEFETIKLGDIFTHVTQFPSASEGTLEGPRLCAQCLNNGHQTGDHTAHENSIQHNNLSSEIDRINTRISSYKLNDTVVVSVASETNPRSADEGDTSEDYGERSAQLLQGVSTVIMQNSNDLQQHQKLPVAQFQQHPQNNPQIHSHSLQSPPLSSQEMHHDHQPHFYQQGGQGMQQVKLEADPIAHQQSHNQQHLENFMLIHDSAMFPDNNESLQQQHLHQTTMVSFHHQQQPDNHLHQTQRQQVICDNQQAEQQQHHQPVAQHITVVASGSDTKYTIPTAVMQMQGKEQDGIDQGQGQQHLIQFPGQHHGVSLPPHTMNGSTGGGTYAKNSPGAGGVDIPQSFQFLSISSLESTKASQNSVVTSILTSTVATLTASTSSISSTATPLATMTSSGSSNKSSGSKARTNKCAKSGPEANSNKNSNAQTGENPKIPCDLCKKKFKNPKMAMNHYKRVHQKEARFVCEICGAVFSYR